MKGSGKCISKVYELRGRQNLPPNNTNAHEIQKVNFTRSKENRILR